ncbi:hypothetical protein D9619_008033 [Psilocybe cf. subviscida]|uniref:Uncharacterized protein n=1 Tax=Psilocybe cf. subviscida TaxID=2480587 RepID=A0A8H5AVY7_9AGAR|nr:hypothetical protein D9619_008033 [Psilocybe cf. subviscida]
MSQTTPQHTESSTSTQSIVTGDSNGSLVAEIVEQTTTSAEQGSQSESSDSDDEQYEWNGGMPRAPLVSLVAGPKPKNRVDTRSKEYLAKASKKKASDSASLISSTSSNTIIAEGSTTKESKKKSGK